MSRTLTKESKQYAAAFALVIATLATSLPVVAAPPASPGGAGKLILNGTGITCFKTSSKRVPLVCGKPQVHYKITTLMGDPLASYGVTWSLFSFHIANAIGGGSQNYLAGSVPGKVWDAAKGVELWLYGAAIVKGSSPMAVLQFNTGLGVKPGGELSLNVPDGYNWDKFLIYPKDGMGSISRVCSENDPKYVAPADAKNLMRKGMALEEFQVCPRSSVDTDRLDRAIDAFCEANPKNPARFCPKEQEKKAEVKKKGEPPDPFATLSNKPSAKAAARKPPGSDPFASLEEGGPSNKPAPPRDMTKAFEQAEAERVAAAERQQKYDAAYASCQQDMVRQESCAKNSCGSEPTAQICLRNEEIEQHCTPEPGTRCLIISRFKCVERGPNPAHAKWEACLRDTATQCAAQGKNISSAAVCASERMKR